MAEVENESLHTDEVEKEGLHAEKEDVSFNEVKILCSFNNTAIFLSITKCCVISPLLLYTVNYSLNERKYITVCVLCSLMMTNVMNI